MIISHLFSYKGLTDVFLDLTNEGNVEEKNMVSTLSTYGNR